MSGPHALLVVHASSGLLERLGLPWVVLRCKLIFLLGFVVITIMRLGIFMLISGCRIVRSGARLSMS